MKILGASGRSNQRFVAAGPGFPLVSFAQYPEGGDNPNRAKGYRFNPLRGQARRKDRGLKILKAPCGVL
jgi:hypothetical protein